MFGGSLLSGAGGVVKKPKVPNLQKWVHASFIYKNPQNFPRPKTPLITFFMIEYLPIFPTPLWVIKGARQELVDELYKGAYKCRDSIESNQLSNQGGYQSPSFSFDDFLPEARQYIIDKVSEIFNCRFKITSWWYNINQEGDWNSPHTHPENDIALVWYVTDNNKELQLQNPYAHARYSLACVIGEKRMNVTVYGKQGDIVMFPSDQLHYVTPNLKKEDRISIAMNIKFVID